MHTRRALIHLHTIARHVSTLQNEDLPYDLALERGNLESAALLASAAWNQGFNPLDEPLVTAAESKVFESLAHLLDPNPRRLKQIISVYALATEVAKRRPLVDGDWKVRYGSCA